MVISFMYCCLIERFLAHPCTTAEAGRARGGCEMPARIAKSVETVDAHLGRTELLGRAYTSVASAEKRKERAGLMAGSPLFAMRLVGSRTGASSRDQGMAQPEMVGKQSRRNEPIIASYFDAMSRVLPVQSSARGDLSEEQASWGYQFGASSGRS